MSISRHNKNVSVDWGQDTKDWQFKKLGELIPGEIYPFKGCFITADNGYGEGAVIISDGYLVNVPERYVDMFRDIMSDPSDVSQIKAGKAGFMYQEFTSKKFNRTGYNLQLVDID